MNCIQIVISLITNLQIPYLFRTTIGLWTGRECVWRQVRLCALICAMSLNNKKNFECCNCRWKAAFFKLSLISSRRAVCWTRYTQTFSRVPNLWSCIHELMRPSNRCTMRPAHMPLFRRAATYNMVWNQIVSIKYDRVALTQFLSLYLPTSMDLGP